MPGWAKGLRFAPGLGALIWAYSAYEFYQWYQNQPGGYDMTGWQKCCDLGGPKDAFRIVWGNAVDPNNGGQPACDYSVGCGWPNQVPSGLDGDAVTYPDQTGGLGQWRYRVFFRGPANAGGTRMTLTEKWAILFRKADGMPDLEWRDPKPWPAMPPVYVPPWVPWFDPFQLPIGVPTPAPLPPPYRILPRRGPRRRPDPKPLPVPVGEIPTLEVTPGAQPVPGSIKQEVPPEGEKEKKGSPLKGKYAAGWVKTLEGLGGGFTEMDDLVSAIYKSLPWQLRRWRGRDGVWRDRDHTTARRIQRIADNLGDVSVLDMVKNIMQNEAIDTIGGVIGELGKQAIDNNRYYRGLGGLQQGERFTKETWNAALEQLRLEAAAKIKPRDYYRHYIILPDGTRINASDFKFRNVRGRTEYGEGEPYRYADLSELPEGWQWGRELVKGTKQKIPWLVYSYNKRVRPRRGTIEWWTINHDKSYNIRRVYRYASN